MTDSPNQYTVAARDNVTIRADGDCMDVVQEVADRMNSELEMRQDQIVHSLCEQMLFGRYSDVR